MFSSTFKVIHIAYSYLFVPHFFSSQIPYIPLYCILQNADRATVIKDKAETDTADLPLLAPLYVQVKWKFLGLETDVPTKPAL